MDARHAFTVTFTGSEVNLIAASSVMAMEKKNISFSREKLCVEKEVTLVGFNNVVLYTTQEKVTFMNASFCIDTSLVRQLDTVSFLILPEIAVGMNAPEILIGLNFL